ncbi:hypothetical protein [Rhodococcus sp. NPDC127528]|uniref:hypothetical protein n=1 Tax=unclassified Rhodococcus (in: high G+C Gram-positive bacteria) TaxID=192944 RepID=UPI0036440AA8
MSSTIARVLAVTAIVVSVGALAAPTASADKRIIGNGSVNICFVVPLPGSADITWCL